MNDDPTALRMAQEGLKQIEDAIVRLLDRNPQGLRNAQIADLLDLRSDFQGNSRNYLTYSVLGGLLAKSKVTKEHAIYRTQSGPGGEHR